MVLSCLGDGVAVVGSDSAGLTRLPTKAREVADVSGAGDTLIALMALGLAADLGLLRAVEIANAAAGAVCGKLGTASLSATELLALMGAGADRHPDETNPKVLAGRQEAGEVGVPSTNGKVAASSWPTAASTSSTPATSGCSDRPAPPATR